MRPREKKITVFRILEREIVPLSLSEIPNKLEYDFKERMLRRWLDEMVQESLGPNCHPNLI